MSSDEIKMILEKLDAMESRQGRIETGIINLGVRLEALENIVEERLPDTRPLWESVQSQISKMREEMQERFDGLESEVKDTGRRVRALNDTLLSMKVNSKRLPDREAKINRRSRIETDSAEYLSEMRS
jgi:predicted  nucleic acid-binding Zn-ribbon protein